MKKVEFEKHKFDTRWKFAMLIALLLFATLLQATKAPMANEFIGVVIGLIGGGAINKHMGA